MRQPLRLGLDFSDAPPGSGAIKAVGRNFVVRYAARDWRGLKVHELADYRANGIDVAMVYESNVGRIQEGHPAGAYDATYAQGFLLEMGMSPTMPIYFAVDYSMPLSDVPRLYAYMQGAGEVIGPERVGIYGGWTAIEAAASTGCRWLWMTSNGSWELGHELHPQAVLWQHIYNYYVNGTNCDKTDAYADNFGQESKFTGVHVPPVIPKPRFPKPDLPDFYDRVNGHQHPSAFTYKNRRYYPVRQRIRAIEETRVLVSPSNKAEEAGDPVKAGQVIEVDWITTDSTGHIYPLNGDGYYRGSRFDPQLFPPKMRNGQVKAVIVDK